MRRTVRRRIAALVLGVGALVFGIATPASAAGPGAHAHGHHHHHSDLMQMQHNQELLLAAGPARGGR